MCIHERVQQENDRDNVDSLCRGMTASWVREHHQKQVRSGDAAPIPLCQYFENYDMDKQGNQIPIPSGLFTIDDIKKYGQRKGYCPYFLTRHLIFHAHILVYNYQYMLDPKVASLISKELAADSIVVFDEAHNIDNVCIEALSVTVDKRGVESMSRSLNLLQTKVREMKIHDTNRLQQEYSQLVNGLIEQGVIAAANASHPNDAILANPLLPQDILQEAVPGSIRRAEHFLAFLKKIVEFFKLRMRSTSVMKDTPLSFVRQLCDATGLERKPLRFVYSRLNSLLRTLEVTSLEDFLAIQDLANFVTLVSTYLQGFTVIMEPEVRTLC